MIGTYTCEHCTSSFQRYGTRRHRFCSAKCADLGRIKVTAALLMPYVERGSTIKVMNSELKFSRRALHFAMRRYGLYRTWALHRFKKCAVAV